MTMIKPPQKMSFVCRLLFITTLSLGPLYSEDGLKRNDLSDVLLTWAKIDICPSAREEDLD